MNGMAGAPTLALVGVALGVGGAFGWTQFGSAASRSVPQLPAWTLSASPSLTLEGAGDGPEELRFPRLFPAAADDSLLVVSGDSRISVVRPDGEVVVAGSFAVADLPRVVIPEGMVDQRFPHVDVDRGLAASTGPRPADPDLVIVDPDSGSRTVLASYRYTTDYLYAVTQGELGLSHVVRYATRPTDGS